MKALRLPLLPLELLEQIFVYLTEPTVNFIIEGVSEMGDDNEEDQADANEENGQEDDGDDSSLISSPFRGMEMRVVFSPSPESLRLIHPRILPTIDYVHKMETGRMQRILNDSYVPKLTTDNRYAGIMFKTQQGDEVQKMAREGRWIFDIDVTCFSPLFDDLPESITDNIRWFGIRDTMDGMHGILKYQLNQAHTMGVFLCACQNLSRRIDDIYYDYMAATGAFISFAREEDISVKRLEYIFAEEFDYVVDGIPTLMQNGLFGGNCRTTRMPNSEVYRRGCVDLKIWNGEQVVQFSEGALVVQHDFSGVEYEDCLSAESSDSCP